MVNEVFGQSFGVKLGLASFVSSVCNTVHSNMPATDKYVYNMKTMNWVFCLSVVSLAASTMLMLHKDHDDAWREYQKQFFVYERELLDVERLEAMESGSRKNYEDRVAILTSEANRLRGELQDGNEAFGTLSGQVDEAALLFDVKGRTVRNTRALRDVAKANRDLGVRDQVSADEMQVLFDLFKASQAKVDGQERELEELDATLKGLQVTLAAITKDRDAAEDELKKYTAEVERLNAALDKIAPQSGLKPYKRVFMEQPIIDGFNSHIRVVQDWLPNLKITLGMASTARFDRCRTCHLGIDRFGAGDVATFPHGDGAHAKNDGDAKTYPHPFASHPRPDVYLTGSSPHPLPEFGCTICHDGTGSATSFYNAQHGPNDPVQEHEWNEKYGHHYNHFWEYPMSSERLRESTCLKCHHDVIELGKNPKYGATAPKVTKGWELIEKYGCFGCHEINGFDAGKNIGPDLRLEPNVEERDKYANDPNLVAGKMRKVGPSLKHVAGKVSKEWIAYWVEEPKRFRPTTTMPQYFGKELTNMHDDMGKDMSSVEIASIAKYLNKQSTPIELLTPALAAADRDAARGKSAFAQKGCLACHTHSAFPEAKADFGPNLSNVYEKLAKEGAGFDWLYTWIREPERHHPRTKMPNFFLVPSTDTNGAVSDPAADIATFLLSGETDTIDDAVFADASSFGQNDLDALAKAYLKAVLTEKQIGEYFESEGKSFPLKREQIKGDEVELIEIATPDKEQWRELLLNYVGKRSVTRYGCYGCHDINGFGTARPIGTSLQDWGRKDPSKLALEHIEEYLHHHGEADGSSTAALVDNAIKDGKVNAFNSEAEKVDLMRRAFFYDSLLHHGRPGFIFQKLRDPRSYDYEKTSTKPYKDRLVMPKFPLKDDEIEAIATFVLGLVAEPPAAKYIYKPKPRERDRNQGEILLRKYNCTGCHMLDMEQIEYAVPEGELAANELSLGEFAEGHAALLKLRPPVNAYTGQFKEVDGKRLPIARFRGLMAQAADPEDAVEDQVHVFTTWESSKLNRPGTDGEGVVLPSSPVIIPGPNLVQRIPAKTGAFALFLSDYLTKNESSRFPQKDLAWQASPPPLLNEGDKVQTGWLYRFLRDPEQIRFTTVLRMPRFNMNDEEAAILANYFAAADGAEYPYQDVPQVEPDYQNRAVATFEQKYPDRATKQSYLDESWAVLMGVSTLPNEKIEGAACTKCHQVGGQIYRQVDIKDPRGPNLENAGQRLRPDWVHVWLFNPKRITPYTSMPINFGSHESKMQPLFDGKSLDQMTGARDALMNYNFIMERKTHRQQLEAPAPVPAVAVPAAN